MNPIQNVKNAIEHRRSYYAINNESPVSDSEIQDIVNFVAKNVPSPFNSQSARLVLLLNEHHTKLWEIVRETLRKLLTGKDFSSTDAKINSFAAGHGTILFFEEQTIVKNLQKNFPDFGDKFPEWSHHSNAMHQFALWILLEDMGLGASLQHYNPLINEAVAKEWNLPASWELLAQMPFGKPVAKPGPKEFLPLENRVKIFK